VNEFVESGKCVNAAMFVTNVAGTVVPTIPGSSCDQIRWEIKSDAPTPSEWSSHRGPSIEYRRRVDDREGVRLGHGDAVLTFYRADPASPRHATVTLDVYTLHASLPFDLDTYDGHGLSDFFDSLAASWRGWDGAREWFNIERDLRLTCHHDGKGRVVVVVTMGIPHPFDSRGWIATATVVVEPGALEAFASAFRQALDGR
jgi:Family of unknown function (DUF6228)